MSYGLSPLITPAADESLASFTLRYAEQNQVGMRDVIRLLDPSKIFLLSATTLSRHIEALSQLTRVDVQDLSQLALRPQCLPSPDVAEAEPARLSLKHAILATRHKYCPHCLRESPYVRRVWELRAYHACHEHGVMLATTCHMYVGRTIWTS